MKRFAISLLAMVLPLLSMAQKTHSLELDASTLSQVAPTNTSTSAIVSDYAKRPCARIYLTVSNMSREDVANLVVELIGSDAVITKQSVAPTNDGLVVELTALANVRLYLRHNKYGQSNDVLLNLEGNKVYKLDACLRQIHSIVVSSDIVGADVYLDGVSKGKIGAGNILTIDNVISGQHKIKVVYGVAKQEQTVDVSKSNIYFRVEVDNLHSRPQYVVFQVNPKDAVVDIGSRSHIPDAEGIVQVVLDNGTYKYSISSKDYHDEAGSFVVNGAKVVKVVNLRPAHGWLSVSGEGELQGAGVYIDGAYVGKAPIKSGNLASGTHNVRIVKNLYKSHDAQVVIRDNETLKYAPDLVADYAHVTLKVANDSEIYVNNEYKGKSTWSGNLVSGSYIFEARKKGHTSSSITKTIAIDPHEQTYEIPAPKPILGTLNITSTPAMADVYIDGVKAGQTPFMLNVVIGEHVVTLRKGDMGSVKQKVYISEGQTTSLNIALKKLTPQSYVENANCGLNMKMIYVEGGTFQMGATSEQGSDVPSDERPVHSVTLDSYYIAEFEVTQAQWYAIMGKNPSSFTGNSNRPVEQITWNDATAFCRELSRLTGKKYVLPTEAQWEYAARGGAQNINLTYEFSGDFSAATVGWTKINSNNVTQPVKSLKPNQLGLYDMTGNVLEWCNDVYGKDYYYYSEPHNPTGPTNGSQHVLRGGSWRHEPKHCRVAHRRRSDPWKKDCNRGLRVVCLQ